MLDEAARLARQASQARFERPLDAKRDWAEAARICRESGEWAGLVHALKGLGQIERDLGNGEVALGFYEEAVSVCRTLDDRRLLAHTIRHVADIQQGLGRVGLAEACYVEALALYRLDVGTTPMDLANSIRGLAILNLKEAVGESTQAAMLWREASELYAESGVEAGVVECSKHLSQKS